MRLLTLMGVVLSLASCTASDVDRNVDDGAPASGERSPAADGPSVSQTAREAAPQNDSDQVQAVATLEPRSGAAVTGEGVFVRQENGVAFGVYVENAEPGLHAVHIHESGDCTAADASSAGDHWNPTDQDHGRWGDDPFHLGDIGNIDVAEAGAGTLELMTDRWSLTESERNVVGRALVVHREPDDFSTQPAGAAGEVRLGLFGQVAASAVGGDDFHHQQRWGSEAPESGRAMQGSAFEDGWRPVLGVNRRRA